MADAETHVLLALTSVLPQADTTFRPPLERFTVQLPPEVAVVAVDFEHVTYPNDNGSSSVTAEIADWRFLGALSWLEPLKDLLAGLLDNGVPTFDGGIFIDYGIPIPGFTLGVLGVSGLRVDLGLDLPDGGASSVDLTVGTRDDPFRITIMGYGGDGSFGLEVDARQIVLIEGSLAVSYELAVDVFLFGRVVVGVARRVRRVRPHGSAPRRPGDPRRLRRAARQPVVHRLFEVSGEVTVSLEYDVGTKMLSGCAAVTAEVSSPFGKKDVTRDVEVEVPLGDGAQLGVAALPAAASADEPAADLTFGDRFTKPQWNTYCAAFAA